MLGLWYNFALCFLFLQKHHHKTGLKSVTKLHKICDWRKHNCWDCDIILNCVSFFIQKPHHKTDLKFVTKLHEILDSRIYVIAGQTAQLYFLQFNKRVPLQIVYTIHVISSSLLSLLVILRLVWKNTVTSSLIGEESPIQTRFYYRTLLDRLAKGLVFV